MYIDSYPPDPNLGDYEHLVRNCGHAHAAESLQLMHVAKMLNVRIHVTTEHTVPVWEPVEGPWDSTGSVRKLPSIPF